VLTSCRALTKLSFSIIYRVSQSHLEADAMTPSHQEFDPDHIPIAFMITLRAHGTWLHGDRRGSVDRFHNRYGTPRLPANRLRQNYERGLLKIPPVKLTARRRAAVYRGIRETCDLRNWRFWALNVRSNHVHSVVTASCHSKKVRAALKANATRTMRESGCWESERSPWSGGGSRRFIWTEQQLIEAIDYVLYGQGEELP
jgi:REP element-mobilizing transposase RayT